MSDQFSSPEKLGPLFLEAAMAEHEEAGSVFIGPGKRMEFAAQLGLAREEVDIKSYMAGMLAGVELELLDLDFLDRQLEENR